MSWIKIIDTCSFIFGECHDFTFLKIIFSVLEVPPRCPGGLPWQTQLDYIASHTHTHTQRYSFQNSELIIALAYINQNLKVQNFSLDDKLLSSRAFAFTHLCILRIQYGAKYLKYVQQTLHEARVYHMFNSNTNWKRKILLISIAPSTTNGSNLCNYLVCWKKEAKF